jgi:nucleotide-binding universal stress UspA family protein
MRRRGCRASRGGLLEQYQVQPATYVEHGALLRQIDERVDASAADVLVLGARGAGFMRHLLLGSTAERMLRRTSRPMLVVERPPQGPYRRLLVAVDFPPVALPACTLARARARRRAGLVDDFLLGSVTRHVLQESLGDVLVCVQDVVRDQLP